MAGETLCVDQVVEKICIAYAGMSGLVESALGSLVAGEAVVLFCLAGETGVSARQTLSVAV